MLTIELVGPAGAGKTTLTKLMVEQYANTLKGEDISLRKKEHLPAFLRYFPALLPTITGLHNSRRFTWDEIKSLVYLRGWAGILRKQMAGKEGILLLDQGPVFRLATLYGFGPECLREPEFEGWWKAMFAQWASFLNAIIWLDAPDLVLAQRIDTRDQKHLVKGKPALESEQFLARYRAAYGWALEGLCAAGGPEPIAYNTSETGLNPIVEKIIILSSHATIEN